MLCFISINATNTSYYAKNKIHVAKFLGNFFTVKKCADWAY